MFFSRILLIFTLTSTLVVAKNYTVTDIPQCPLSCLLEAVSASKCSPIDLHCQCNDKALFRATAHCVLAKCSQSDDIKLSKVQASMCNRPEASRSSELCRIVTIMLVVVTFTSVLRFISCWRVKGGLFIEDYTIIAGLLTTYIACTLVYLMINNGFGNHIYQIALNQSVTNILRYFWVAELVYAAQIVLVKISLVFFFLRIFPQRKFRYACYGLIVFMIVTAILLFFLLIFQCRPISSNWNVNIARPKCQDVQIYVYIGAGIAMLDDTMILILPIPVLLRLQITLKQKFAVMALFSLGVFVLITSAIRLRYVSTLGESADPTWDNINITIWTALEIDVSLICCNMPAIAGLVTHYHRKFFPSSPENKSEVPVVQMKKSWSDSDRALYTPEERPRHVRNGTASSVSDIDLENGTPTPRNTSIDWNDPRGENTHIYGVNETVVTSTPRKPHIANLITANGYEVEMERKKREREREMGEVIVVSRSVIVREEWDDRSSMASSRRGFGNKSRASSQSVPSTRRGKGAGEPESLEEMFEPWPGEEC